MEPIKRILPRSLKDPSVAKGIATAAVIEAARKALADVLGTDAAARTEPVTFKEGTLTVICERAVYAEEVRLRAAEIAAAANRILGREAVTGVRSRG